MPNLDTAEAVLATATERVLGKKKVKALTAAEILQEACDGNDKAMKALFIISAYHADNFYDRLQKAGFDLDKMKGVRLEGNTVYVFTQDELSSLLKKANLCVSKKMPSKTQNVEWIWLDAIPKLPQNVLNYTGVPDVNAFSRADIEVQDIGNDDGLAYKFIIATMLYPLLKRPIVFSVPHAHTKEYRPDGPFNIYIWSTPTGGSGRRDRQPPECVWGIGIPCRDNAYVPETKRGPIQFGGTEYAGVVIYDGTYAVAELFPNALYVHHDLVNNYEPEELELFAELLHRCRRILKGPKAFEKYRQEAERVRLEAERNAFPLLVERSVEKRAHRQKNAVETAERFAAEKKREYFEAERTLFAERQTLLDPKIAKAHFLAEYEKLQSGKVEMIEGMTFNPSDTESTITLHTGEITIDHPRDGTTRLIGRCDAMYNLETGNVRIVNRDRTFKSDGNIFHTPHVFEEGGRNVCLGNIRSELVAYIAHYELEAAAVLTVAFLQSVRDDKSYLTYLELFPVIDKKNHTTASQTTTQKEHV